MTDRERLEYFYDLSDRAASDWRSSPVVARIVRWLHPGLGNVLDRMVLGTPEPDGEFDEHRMTPIPVPPFRDDADEKAALAAAVAVVASLVLGEWPHPDRLSHAVEALLGKADGEQEAIRDAIERGDL